ncbi:ROK family transcriptional regulator [Streptomyces marispadix]|uniref:ROK family transcriptional regulator n=1 Tax=Streptomyces marispadix TaxID=2922868 RepID=A0ABS9SWM0_9ACTN|nr:ROK family transcriptional regulator [Streptomyces marispadix]MCH6160687.1 ROK family transcriptional regulator [Streptomyces marispadix]
MNSSSGSADVPPSWRPLTPAERAVAIEVLTNGPTSRSEIARRLGMSGGSLTRLAKPLIDSGLLLEALTPVPSAGQGRPGRPLDIVTDPWHFVGLKITADTVYGVVTTLKSSVVRREDRKLGSAEPDAVADAAHSIVRTFAEDFPHLAGIGVGLGGQVRERAVAVDSPYLGWEEVPFAELLEERTGLPVVVENDFAALVEAETWFGAGRGLDRFAVLTIGAGVGYGLVIGGEPVRLPDEHYSGTAERWILDPSGPLTPYGERGSATSLLTVQSIEYQVRAATGSQVGYEEILELAGRGDPAASRVVGEAARGLGVLISHIANFALPQKILLAGEGVGLMDVAGETVFETLAAHRNPRADPVDLETKVSDFHDWARGAAVLAIQVLVLGEAPGD